MRLPTGQWTFKSNYRLADARALGAVTVLPFQVPAIPVYGRPARRQPSGVVSWARRKCLTK